MSEHMNGLSFEPAIVMIQMPPLGRWSDSVPDAPTPAPRLGEHNDLLKEAAAKAWSKT